MKFSDLYGGAEVTVTFEVTKQQPRCTVLKAKGGKFSWHFFESETLEVHLGQDYEVTNNENELEIEEGTCLVHYSWRGNNHYKVLLKSSKEGIPTFFLQYNDDADLQEPKRYLEHAQSDFQRKRGWDYWKPSTEATDGPE
jgi:hypothetical protein